MATCSASRSGLGCSSWLDQQIRAGDDDMIEPPTTRMLSTIKCNSVSSSQTGQGNHSMSSVTYIMSATGMKATVKELFT